MRDLTEIYDNCLSMAGLDELQILQLIWLNILDESEKKDELPSTK